MFKSPSFDIVLAADRSSAASDECFSVRVCVRVLWPTTDIGCGWKKQNNLITVWEKINWREKRKKKKKKKESWSKETQEITCITSLPSGNGRNRAQKLHIPVWCFSEGKWRRELNEKRWSDRKHAVSTNQTRIWIFIEKSMWLAVKSENVYLKFFFGMGKKSNYVTAKNWQRTTVDRCLLMY